MSRPAQPTSAARACHSPVSYVSGVSVLASTSRQPLRSSNRARTAACSSASAALYSRSGIAAAGTDEVPHELAGGVPVPEGPEEAEPVVEEPVVEEPVVEEPVVEEPVDAAPIVVLTVAGPSMARPCP